MNLKIILKRIISEFVKVIDKFKKSYQPRTKIVKDEKCDKLGELHRNLAVCRSLFPVL